MASENQVPHGSQPPVNEEVESDKVGAPVVEEKETKPEMDYEKSYKELQSKFGEHSNQVGELRKQNQELLSKFSTLEQAAQQREEQARNQEPPTDYEQMLRDVAAKYDNGDITYEQSLLESNKITRDMTRAEAAMEREQLLEQVRGEAQQMLSDKDFEAVVDRFHDSNPEFVQLQESGVLEQAMAQDPLLTELAAFYKVQADRAFAKGKEEAARIASGSEKAAKVLADSGASMQQQGKPRGEAGVKASMLAALTQ